MDFTAWLYLLDDPAQIVAGLFGAAVGGLVLGGVALAISLVIPRNSGD